MRAKLLAVAFILSTSCVTTKAKEPSTAIICPDVTKHKILFCNCFVKARTLEGNKPRYLFIPCPTQDVPVKQYNETATVTQQVRSKVSNAE